MEEPKPKPTLSDLTMHFPTLEVIVPELTSKDLYSLARSSRQNWLNIMANTTSARNLMQKTTCDGEGVKWKLVVTGMFDVFGAQFDNLGRPGCQKISNQICELCGFKVCRECKYSDDDDIEGFHFQAQDGFIINGRPVTGTIRHSDIMNMVACEVCRSPRQHDGICDCRFFKSRVICKLCTKNKVKKDANIGKMRLLEGRAWGVFQPEAKVKDCACGAQVRDEKLHQYCARCHRLVGRTVYEMRWAPPQDRAATASMLAQEFPGANIVFFVETSFPYQAELFPKR